MSAHLENCSAMTVSREDWIAMASQLATMAIEYGAYRVMLLILLLLVNAPTAVLVGYFLLNAVYFIFVVSPLASRLNRWVHSKIEAAYMWYRKRKSRK